MSFPRYERHKDSGVEWLGDVPQHWEVIPIKQLSQVRRGASPRPIEDQRYFDDEGEYGWVRIADVSASSGILTETTQRMSEIGSGLSVKMQPGELFISIAGTVGKPCIAGIKACIHDGFVYFPGLKINPRFLYYLFEAGTCYAGLGKMGTQLNLNTDTIGSIRIALPPPIELAAIIRLILDQTEKIDALIREQVRLIELLKEKRQAVISHAVTKGLNPNAPMKDSGIDWLGKVPAQWNVVPLRFLSRFISGGTPDKREASYWEGLVPWVSSKDMKVSQISDSEDHISERAVIESGLKTISAGHILIVVRGMILAHTLPVAMTCGDITINQDLKALKCAVGLRPTFLQFVLDGLSSHILANAGESAHGTKKLETDVLGQLAIPLPPTAEQELIVATLNRECEIVEKLTTEATHVVDLLQERRNALISAAVTGKIDVRNDVPKEAYEPA